MSEKAKSITGVQQWPFRAVAKGLEVIPRTLIQNCGANTIRTLTALRVCINYLFITLHNILYLFECFKSYFTWYTALFKE